jgi:hypothetical protein
MGGDLEPRRHEGHKEKDKEKNYPQMSQMAADDEARPSGVARRYSSRPVFIGDICAYLA